MAIRARIFQKFFLQNLLDIYIHLKYQQMHLVFKIL